MANNLGVSTYTVGGDYDSWGDKLVADLAILNKFAGDVLTLSETSGPVTLTTTQCQNFGLKMTGTGSTTVDYRVPDSISRFWYVNNARSSGSITVRCAAGGTSVTLLAGEKRLVFSDGTNCIDLTILTLAISSISGLQAALDAKAALASPTFTGNPLAPTPSPGDNDTSIATTGFVKAAIDVVLGGVSSAFDTLSEIATALATKLTASSNLSDLGSAATARTNLGLGSIATQASSAVSISGGAITGITDLALADGGTGASTAANARTNLGLGSGNSPSFAGMTSSGDITASGNGYFSNVIASGDGLFSTSIGGNAAVASVSAGNNTNEGLFYEAGLSLTVATDGVVLGLNRITTDGDILRFYGQGTQEGAISVSGTTITYGSATIAHWGQFAGNERRDIRRGTILQTIDEMCEWWEFVIALPDGTLVHQEVAKDDRVEGETYKIEYEWAHKGVPGIVTETITVDAVFRKQLKDYLPRVKIADTAGAINGAGLFINQDQDYTHTNDINYAGAGTFDILLQPGESPVAGDLIEIGTVPGCGRVQAPGGDPRAVIAKINAAVVLKTYEDGAFVMPCYVRAG